MKTLTIKDLARTEELDRSAMSAVRGGWKMEPMYKFGDVTYSPSHDSSIDAVQKIMQQQDSLNAVANESAFLDNIHVTNNVSQDATNKIVRL
jgi:hypothetical protein